MDLHPFLILFCILFLPPILIFLIRCGCSLNLTIHGWTKKTVENVETMTPANTLVCNSPEKVHPPSTAAIAVSVECPICLAALPGGENVRVLPRCRHKFHTKCVDKWLITHFSCHTCRHPVFASLPDSLRSSLHPLRFPLANSPSHPPRL